MSIYVITHKKFRKRVNNGFYKILLVGCDNGNTGYSNYLRDNVGNNISGKNKNFCELTGEYWVWKNRRDKVIGFDHYRRYFIVRKHRFWMGKPLLKSQILNDLKTYDIILPQKTVLEGMTAENQFGYRHDPVVWQKTRNIIKDQYPNYLKDFDWFSNEKKGYCYNMLICYKDIFNKYSEWLYSILFLLEKELDLTKYNSYNQRMFGFLSERLLNVWVHHMSLKVKEYPIFNVSTDSFQAKIKVNLKNLINLK